MRKSPNSCMLGTWVLTLVGFSMGEPLRGQSDQQIINSIGMQLNRVPAGTFKMGSVRGNPDADLDEAQHEVTITKDFFLGVYEVTQSQYEKVMGENPSQFRTGVEGLNASDYPVEQVSWEDARAFCEKLSALPEEQRAGRVYRLPTEAEWEMGCRAGTQTAFSFGNEVRKLAEHAWYEANSEGRTHKVGMKKPNLLGLHDMHGNVWEWVADWYIEHRVQSVTDPRGPARGTDRVYRGGSWNYGPGYLRSANRTATRSDFRGFEFLSIGFRVALSPEEIVPEGEESKSAGRGK